MLSKTRIVFFIAFICSAILVVIFLMLISSKKQGLLPNTSIPSPTPVSVNSPQYFTGNNQIKPPIEYATGSAKKVTNAVTQKQPLNPSDALAKQNLINSIGPYVTYILVKPTYRAEYIAKLDEVLVEITDPNIVQAKTDTVAWLTSLGFSHEGICNLPVIFYLNFNVAQQLQKQGNATPFNPLPDGC